MSGQPCGQLALSVIEACFYDVISVIIRMGIVGRTGQIVQQDHKSIQEKDFRYDAIRSHCCRTKVRRLSLSNFVKCIQQFSYIMTEIEQIIRNRS